MTKNQQNLQLKLECGLRAAVTSKFVENAKNWFHHKVSIEHNFKSHFWELPKPDFLAPLWKSTWGKVCAKFHPLFTIWTIWLKYGF